MTTEYQNFRLKCLAAIRRGNCDEHFAYLHNGLNLKLHCTEQDEKSESVHVTVSPVCTIYFHEQIIPPKADFEVDRFHDVFADELRKRKRTIFVEN
jgi:hypothetical protein